MLLKIKNILKKANKFRHRIFRGSNLYFFVFIYFAVLMILMMAYGQWLSPDRFIIFGLFLALIVANPVNFVKDWAPFIVLILSYEFMRGLVPHLTTQVNIFPLINTDLFLFGGHLPTVELQRWFYVDGVIRYYDYVFAFFYMMHFALPLAIGFILWVKKREKFQHYAITFLVLSYLGFLTYLIYPAMPPWMASEQGFIPQISKIFDGVTANLFHSGNLPTIYWIFGPNKVAAMPSLHAAYPLLVLLYMVKNFGKRWLWFFIYVLIVWFAIVYMGEHYVIDVIVGAIYAIVVFFFMEFILDKLFKRFRKKTEITIKEPVKI